jgi:DNA polymerase-1
MIYPDLKNEEVICIDIETKDPELLNMGPGVFRKDGYIIGVGIATPIFAEYYNIGHFNIPDKHRIENLKYITDVLGNNVPKIGANLYYDIDWLENYQGIKVNGQLVDVQTAEGLIDEYQGKYSLNFLSEKYLNKTKYYSEIEEYATQMGWSGNAVSNLWRMPYGVARAYAIVDVKNPIEIWEKQKPILIDEEMLDLFYMECDMIRTLLKLRKNGVRIDVEQRDKNSLLVQNTMEALQEKFGDLNVKSTKSLAAMFDAFSIPYPYTEKGNPSITSDVLQSLKNEYPIAEEIYTLRKCKTELSNFLQGSLLEHVVEGNRIHCSFFNTKTDDYGTKSGRLSSANPNLQQIPGDRDPFFYKITRELFIPEEGCIWGKLDFSQIEYRILAHYAEGPGSDKLKESYINNPNTDYHQFIMDATGMPRKLAKNYNFGCLYGMGTPTIAYKFNMTLEDARANYDIYHRKAPYIKHTIRNIERVAKNRGYLRTILNRRAHVQSSSKLFTFTNRLIQGSAADIMKKSMIEVDRAGLFDILIPHITVHDELDFSIPVNQDGVDATNELKRIFETCVELKVPVVANLEVGSNWYDLNEVEVLTNEIVQDIYRRDIIWGKKKVV